MADQSRPTFEDYRAQLLQDIDDRLFTSEKYYESYLNGLTTEVKNGKFSDLVRSLSEFRNEYIKPDFLFLTEPSEADLSFKPLSSVYNKLYRINVLQSRKWPPADNANTISLRDFHERLDDIFRTRFICKYLDGPQFVCQKLKTLCDSTGVSSHFRAVTTNLGYHAWHFYYKQPIEDFGGRGRAEVNVEFQFTTQLAEVISSLTHVHYESTRLGEKFDDGWRWNVHSKQFRPYYIAHGLHLLEGIILEFRDAIIREVPGDANNDDGGINE